MIRVKIHSDRKAVNSFLNELRKLLTGKHFNIDRELIIIKSKKERIEYSTSYTMVDLEYDAYDVAEILKKLTAREYSHTLIDRNDDNPPLLFVFGKEINGRMVYIKLKMKGDENRRILCLSFHYAEYDMEFPYLSK